MRPPNPETSKTFAVGRFACGLIFLAAQMATLGPASAQTRYGNTTSNNSQSVRFSVNYSLRIAYNPDDAEASAKALEDGRKTIYKIIGGECRLLRSTIASSCRIVSATVRAKPSYRSRYRRRLKNSNPTIDLNASAQLNIRLKPTEDGQ